MKRGIDSEVEPRTIYVYYVPSLDEVRYKRFKLAGATSRDRWTVTVGDHVTEFVRKGISFTLA